MKGDDDRGKTTVDALAARILADAKFAGDDLTAWRKPMRQIQSLFRRDYVRAVRKCLGYREVKSMMSAAAEIWPHLNREQMYVPSNQHADIARRLSVHLSAQPYRSAEGLALRGFYVHRASSLFNQPLIYLNTAHHPTVVAATFGHEIGHHLAYRVIEEPGNQVHFFFDSAHLEHLDDPVELLADALVAVGCYPEPIARRIFTSGPWQGGLVARAQNLSEDAVAQICRHLKKDYHLDITRPGQPRRNLVYLAGVVHYAKLRWALLAEYDL